jgi:hypothetical protein
MTLKLILSLRLQTSRDWEGRQKTFSFICK